MWIHDNKKHSRGDKMKPDFDFNDTNCICCEHKGREVKLKLIDKNPEKWQCPRCGDVIELPFRTEQTMMSLAPLHWQGVVKDVKMIECYGCHTKFMGYKDSLVCPECFNQMAVYPSGVY